jgi:3-(3-hydroxy-phenyl)propionate hydroxylase
VRTLVIGETLRDTDGLFARRYDATPGATYLVRPDQHLAARWREGRPEPIAAAARRMRGLA